ncbi:Eco57I restriction-modification methylase domain-containing protein [Acidaminobacter hydrogenoformans]|uniref:site-specific DNA-methyltransferase (adenine-specific) n=1 Tax=Acidaminobacter hydrogenoformans DSM 2784 TaxID=1120920 RepID=A0A1G5RSV0_9FIRM|nr:Eco57I restriction-modification methylase domain-containing protein [Acidaminobacter hydrogenoformans]SCZ77175.1 adenine-specific DNA-methyltransferase [Acidaminobacter hydrogenoformans DSM 2784]
MERTLKACYEAWGGLDREMHQQHRDQTGSFYTPFDVAYETVKTAAVRRLSYVAKVKPDEVQRLFDQPESSPETASQWLKRMVKWHVVDPAGGDGVFAVAWLSFLEQLLVTLDMDHGLLTEAAIRTHLFDLQPEPVAQYKDRMSAYFELPPDALSSYTGNVLDTDRLFQSHPAADVLAGGGYDLVVGNPPYIGEKNHKALFDEAKSYPFGAAHYEKNMDFFYYFIHLGIALLAEGGVMGLITTGYFFTADGGAGLRKAMSSQGSFTDMARFGGGSLFKDAAGQDNVIFHYRRGTKENCRYVEVPAKPKALQASERWRQAGDILTLTPGQIVSRFGNFYFSLHPGEPMAIEEIEASCNRTFGECFEVRQGIVSGYDRAPEVGVFVLTPEEAERLALETSLLVPFYKNSQVKRGKVDVEARFQLLYIPGEIQEFETRFPGAFRHLSRFREKLSRRREVKNGVRPWYALQWPRTEAMFEGPKIVVPHRALNNAFAYTDQPYYGSADLYYLTPKEYSETFEPCGDSSRETVGQMTFWEGVSEAAALMITNEVKASGTLTLSREDLIATALLLSTDLYAFWLSVRGKRKGDVLELYATPLRQMPLPDYKSAAHWYDPLKAMAVDHYSRYGELCDEVIRRKANDLACEGLRLSEATIKTIETFVASKNK